jgi:acyl carrier protein
LIGMATFTIQHLQDIAREIIGDGDIVLSPSMSASDVPGWDSLNHTLIAMEIAGRFTPQVDAQQLGRLATFGDVVDFVNARM